MDDEKIEETRAKLPDDAVIYRPEREMYQKLRLCIYMRELLDNPPLDQDQPEPERTEKK